MKIKLNIKNKLFLLISFVILPLLIISIGIVIFFSFSMMNNVNKQTEIESQSIQKQYNSFISNLTTYSNLIADTPDIKDSVEKGNIQLIRESLSVYLKRLNVDFLSVHDTDGYLLGKGHNVDEYFINESKLDYVKKGLEEKRLRETIAPVKEGLIAIITKPIYSLFYPDQNVGIASIGYRIDSNFAKLLKGNNNNIDILLFSDKSVIGSTINLNILVNEQKDLVNEVYSNKSKNGVTLRTLEKKYVTNVIKIKGDSDSDIKLTILIGVDDTEARKTIGLTILIVFFLIIISIIIAFFLTISRVKGFVEPINQLMNSAKIISEGNLDHKVDIKTNDEIALLGGDFNRMTESLKKFYNNLEKLNRIGVELGAIIDINDSLKRLLIRTEELAESDHGVVFIFDEMMKIKYKAYQGIDEKHMGNISDLDAAVLNYFQTNLKQFNGNNEDYYILTNNLSDEIILRFFENCKSLIATPVIHNNEIVGLICSARNIKYDVKDLELLKSVRIYLVDIDMKDKMLSQERLKGEMEVAVRIQTSLCPPEITNPDLEISASMTPAEEVGGDYYDITTDKSGNIWFAIGDVSGHGVTPGLIMMMAQTSFNTSLVEENITPKDVIVKVNQILTENVRNRLNVSHFMTMSFFKYLGAGKFIYSGAHLDIIVWRKKTGKCEMYGTEGIFLAITKDISQSAKNSELMLESGDIMILYTDGIPESRSANNNKELWNTVNLTECIEKYAHKGVKELRENILKKALDWCDNKPDDDMTIVVIKKK